MNGIHVTSGAGLKVEDCRFMDEEQEKALNWTREDLLALESHGKPARLARRMPFRIRVRRLVKRALARL